MSDSGDSGSTGATALKKVSFSMIKADGDKVVARRFRTKLCARFSLQGYCVYEQRCMFAHGMENLRTLEQNLADGLTSEKAVRRFKQASVATEGTMPSGAILPPPPVTVMVSPSPTHMARSTSSASDQHDEGEVHRPTLAVHVRTRPIVIPFKHNPYTNVLSSE